MLCTVNFRRITAGRCLRNIKRKKKNSSSTENEIEDQRSLNTFIVIEFSASTRRLGFICLHSIEIKNKNECISQIIIYIRIDTLQSRLTPNNKSCVSRLKINETLYNFI